MLFACQEKNKKDIVATVGKNNLYVEDIKTILPSGLLPADSIVFVNNYIQNWVENEVMAYYAEKEINSNDENIEKQIEKYKKALLINKFENKYIESKIDSLSNEKEILDYYNKNISEFELNSNIVKVNFIKLPIDSPHKEKLKRMIFADRINKNKIEEICKVVSENYFFNENIWLQFDEILKEIPIKTDNQENFLTQNKEIEILDSTNIYFVKIFDFKTKKEYSPLSYQKDNIRMIILNQKKIELLNSFRMEVFQKAKTEGLINIKK